MTRDQYRLRVVADVANRTGWSLAQADRYIGEIENEDFERLEPAELADELLA